LDFYAAILAVGGEHLDLLRPSIPKYGANKLFCKFYPEKVKFFSLINKNRVKGNETQRLLETITVIINTNSCAGVCKSPYSSCVNLYQPNTPLLDLGNSLEHVGQTPPHLSDRLHLKFLQPEWF